MGDITKESRSPLLPDRYPTPDFFVCDFFDAVPKGDMASMEHPIFSLSTKPDLRQRRYEHNGHFVEITPSILGLATIHDRDVLIYCISQLIAGLNDNRPLSQIVRFKAYDLLQATNRVTDGRGYEALKAALERLRGTTISTNVATGDEEQFNVFGLIESAKIVRKTRDGRMQEVEIKISDWVFNAIRAQEILTLSRDYFRLRKPLERRIYELARKHCGKQKSWRISLDLLQKKCGSNSTGREFRRLVANIARQDANFSHMPDYTIRLEGDHVVFANKGTVARPKADDDHFALPILKPDTHDKAKKFAAGWDVYGIEKEWHSMLCEKRSVPDKPDGSFIGYVKWYVGQHGPAR